MVIARRDVSEIIVVGGKVDGCVFVVPGGDWGRAGCASCRSVVFHGGKLIMWARLLFLLATSFGVYSCEGGVDASAVVRVS